MASGFVEKFNVLFGIKLDDGTTFHMDADVEIEGEYDYDPGYWRNANGDGCPPSLDYDFEVCDVDALRAHVRGAFAESDTPWQEKYADMAVAEVYAAVERKLADKDDWGFDDSDEE